MEVDRDFTVELRLIEKAIKEALPFSPSDSWKIESFGSVVDSRHLESLIKPTRNLVDLGGKRWRPLLLILSAAAYQESHKIPLSLDMAYNLTPLVEFVHTASLIHDDIEDSSDSRRGKPAAYITFGLDTSLNAASWLYFQAATCINSCGEDENSEKLKILLYKLYGLNLRKLHLGQAMDISWHNAGGMENLPSQSEYDEMVKNKTGTLASFASSIGVLVAGGDWETSLKAGEIASSIGRGFQILDDVINLTEGNPGKKRGDDIVEGKKSLPVILFATQESPTATKELENYFLKAKEEGIGSPFVEKAISLLLKSGCVEQAREIGISAINSGCSAYKHLFGETESVFRIQALFSAMIPKIHNFCAKGGAS